jgi:hypothetical protein
MRKNSSILKNKGLLVALFVILVGGISLGYAYLSATLTINGTTNISKVGWDIHFFDATVTDGSVENGTAAGAIIHSDDPTTASWSATLSTPGDFYEFQLYVGNFGTINAKLDQLDTDATKKWIKNTATVVYADDNSALSAEDQAKFDAIYTYTVTGEPVDHLAKASGTTPTSYPLKFRVEFKRDINGEDLIDRPIKVTYFYQLKYVQD